MPSTNENGQSPDDEMLPGMMGPMEPMMEEDNLPVSNADGDAKDTTTDEISLYALSIG